MELYRKIPCSERLPEKEGEYDTNEGNAIFKSQSFFGFYNDEGGIVYGEIYPAYWLEPVTIPTDEEIEKMASKELPNPEWGAADRLIWKSGFKSALELLTK